MANYNKFKNKKNMFNILKKSLLLFFELSYTVFYFRKQFYILFFTFWIRMEDADPDPGGILPNSGPKNSKFAFLT